MGDACVISLIDNPDCDCPLEEKYKVNNYKNFGRHCEHFKDHGRFVSKLIII